MLKIAVLLLFILTNSVGFAKSTNITQVKNKGIKEVIKKIKKDILKKNEKSQKKQLAKINQEEQEENDSEDISENKQVPSLLESVNHSEKTKNDLQKELLKNYDFELDQPLKINREISTSKKAINLGDVELQISKGSEEVLNKKKKSKKKSYFLDIKSK